jgi:hypothetical protein
MKTFFIATGNIGNQRDTARNIGDLADDDIE